VCENTRCSVVAVSLVSACPAQNSRQDSNGFAMESALRNSAATVDELRVSRVDGVAALLRFAEDIDRLNQASARPNAFSSAAFLTQYALRSESCNPGSGERLYLVRERDRIIGCAPMRQARQCLTPARWEPLRLCGTRLDFLASFDTEQLQFLCAPQDELRVTEALLDHFCLRERGWGLLELVGQKLGGVAHRAVHARNGWQFCARDIAVEPFTEVPLMGLDLPGYFRSLDKHMRSNIGRQARRLYASGQTQLVFAHGAQAASAWFEAYRDLESRSWKRGTVSSIERSPRRVRLYRELCAGRAGFDPTFIGVILDGVLIAGLLVGSNESGSPARHGAWCLEMAYDLSRSDLGPGQLLLLLAVADALERRHRFLNFLQNFAYYKHRWGAESIAVTNVQLVRRLTPHDGRARMRQLRRHWQARRAPVNPDSGPPLTPEAAKSHPEPDATAQQLPPIVDLERAHRVTTAALAASGEGLTVLDRAASRAYLPFHLE